MKAPLWPHGSRRRKSASSPCGVAGGASLTIDALDPCDDGLGAQLGDDSAEMLQVIDLEINGQFGEVGRAARHADIVDIAVMLGDHGGDLGEASRLVDVVDLDS